MINSFTCPECESTEIKSITKTNNKNLNGPYKNVNEEIQCANCFIDIPSNLSLNITSTKKEVKKLWIEIYKPEHLKLAAKCSKCELYYWEIEKKLTIKNSNDGNIFYQSYNVEGGGGKLVCKLCDPKSFQQ